jgi:hypothetical protein
MVEKDIAAVRVPFFGSTELRPVSLAKYLAFLDKPIEALAIP